MSGDHQHLAAHTATTIYTPPQEPLTMLCVRCQALCSSIDLHQDNDFLHHETVEEIRTSAHFGCRFCNIIHREIEENLDEPVSISFRVAIKTRRDAGIEVSFVDTIPEITRSPQNDRRRPVIYVIFSSFRLPSESSCA